MPNMLSRWFQDQVNPLLAEEEIPVCVMRLRKNSCSATIALQELWLVLLLLMTSNMNGWELL